MCARSLVREPDHASSRAADAKSTRRAVVTLCVAGAACLAGCTGPGARERFAAGRCTLTPAAGDGSTLPAPPEPASDATPDVPPGLSVDPTATWPAAAPWPAQIAIVLPPTTTGGPTPRASAAVSFSFTRRDRPFHPLAAELAGVDALPTPGPR